MTQVPALLELVLALTVGLGAGEGPGQAVGWRVSALLELSVSGCVCGRCGLGGGEQSKLCLRIWCLPCSFSSILQQKPAD